MSEKTVHRNEETIKQIKELVSGRIEYTEVLNFAQGKGGVSLRDSVAMDVFKTICRRETQWRKARIPRI